MSAPLTKRQHGVLEMVKKYIHQHGYAPSMAEIAAALGLSSLATVHKHLENLRRKRYIARVYGYGRSRSIELLEIDGVCPTCGRARETVPEPSANI